VSFLRPKYRVIINPEQQISPMTAFGTYLLIHQVPLRVATISIDHAAYTGIYTKHLKHNPLLREHHHSRLLIDLEPGQQIIPNQRNALHIGIQTNTYV
jgi:hypothetical protein